MTRRVLLDEQGDMVGAGRPDQPLDLSLDRRAAAEEPHVTALRRGPLVQVADGGLIGWPHRPDANDASVHRERVDARRVRPHRVDTHGVLLVVPATQPSRGATAVRQGRRSYPLGTDRSW